MSNLELAKDFHKHLTPQIPTEEPTKRILAYLFVSSICHQLQSLKGRGMNGQELRGFNYLCERVSALAKQNPKELDAENLANITAKRLQALLLGEGVGEHTTIHDAEGRARILRDIYSRVSPELLEEMLEWDRFPIREIYAKIASNLGYAFSRDPFYKKASIFIQMMVLGGVWHIENLDDFIPTVDYHKQRLLLRNCCVVPIAQKVQKTLREAEPASPEIEYRLRGACVDAIRIIANNSTKSVMEASIMLWAIGRNCCTKHQPACALEDVVCSRDFCDLPNYIANGCLEECLLVSVCPASEAEALRAYKEPNILTELY